MVVNIHDAKTNLSKLLLRVEKGETVQIARAGKVIAELSKPPALKRVRTMGGAKGKIWISEDFDAPLSKEELKHWGYE